MTSKPNIYAVRIIRSEDGWEPATPDGHDSILNYIGEMQSIHSLSFGAALKFFADISQIAFPSNGVYTVRFNTSSPILQLIDHRLSLKQRLPLIQAGLMECGIRLDKQPLN